MATAATKNSSVQIINVSELKDMIRRENGINNFLIKLSRERKKYLVHVFPENIDDFPTSSELIFTKYIIPIFLKRKGGDQELYSPNPKRRSPQTPGLGFKNKKTAKKSVEKIRRRNDTYQKQALGAMYYRAKHHPRRTRKMLNAMEIYKKRLHELGSVVT